jgi:hypothetical protein
MGVKYTWAGVTKKMDNGLKTAKTFRSDCQSDRMDGTA